MSKLARRSLIALAITAAAVVVRAQTAPHGTVDRARVLDAMKRATAFMVEKVSTNGGYVWSYTPDLSRRWGEMEARPTMIWVQPPGTPTMGHLFLDAYHATGDEYYYRAAARAADALILGQLPSGGWNYVVDFAGERSLREWYDTVGKNGWRLEEFQHYWGNATFDDSGTAESTKLLLRLYLEKREPRYKEALDKAIAFVLDSQFPMGAWPQRYPPMNPFTKQGKPDYTSFITFNDDVTAGNVDLLITCYQALGDRRLIDPIARGMNAFLVTQQPAPQAGWALQYTADLKPAGARTYEPAALVTHTTARNVEQLMTFYRLTGDRKFLQRIPEALDWLDAVRVGPDVARYAGGLTHPTFVEVGTNRPLYIHRRGSNATNGAYTVDYDPRNTVAHYRSFRPIDVAALRTAYRTLRDMPLAEATAASPLKSDSPRGALPPFFVGRTEAPEGTRDSGRVADIIASLDADGRWLTELGRTSNPYRGDGPAKPAPGDYSQTQVGDASDTSPYPVEHFKGISTSRYISNMSVLIRYADESRPGGTSPGGARSAPTETPDMRDDVPRAGTVIPLWPEGVPGRLPNASAEVLADGRASNVHEPAMTAYPVAAASQPAPAVIICPGGGYQRIAIDKEGTEVARWLNSLGVSAFVLKYRLKEYGHPAPLRDVLRAIRLTRKNAASWGIDPARIGVMGFSAGGHLAATAATLFDAPEGRTGAPLDEVSARPDFVILVYPVITFKGQATHVGSRDNLLGKNAPGDLVDHLSAELQVTAKTPPAFLVHGGTDTAVPAENSVLFYGALRRAGVPAELHLYEKGPHGFGLARDLGPISDWPKRAAEWLAVRGVLGAHGPATQSPAQRGDLGNGRYLNPIFAGDHPDPSVLKDGDDYYITFSSFDASPGLVIWHSRDLVNWEPVGPTLFTNVGSVWAPDLVKHNGRYYIYFPARRPGHASNYVVWADSIHGPWSAPIDLRIGQIDPGHAVGPDGKRYLFLSGGNMIALADDGLSVTGAMKKVYDGWRYPDDWVVESFSQEGPKILKRGDYYYMILAEGGTAGPATGHMVVAARARSLEGPWENCPGNPIIRTGSPAERWWSKGHATLVEGPGGQWYAVYHAYENGFYNLGRQTLLEPIEWTTDGWFRTVAADAAAPLPKPAGEAVKHRAALSDDFSTNRMGLQWSFYDPSDADRDRYRYEDGALVLKGKGATPADSSPLSFVCGDHAYEIQVTVTIDQKATAGLLLFYNRRLYAGIGYSATNLILHRYGTDRLLARPSAGGTTLHLRLVNDRHIVSLYYSSDGQKWDRLDTRMDVSGYHHNVAGDFLSLRPAIYAAGTGQVRFRDFRYRPLSER